MISGRGFEACITRHCLYGTRPKLQDLTTWPQPSCKLSQDEVVQALLEGKANVNKAPPPECVLGLRGLGWDLRLGCLDSHLPLQLLQSSCGYQSRRCR